MPVEWYYFLNMQQTLLALFFILVVCVNSTPAQNRGYYRHPAIYAQSVVFTAEGDLWQVGLAGGMARRLTTHPAEETNAVFSPDGNTIAFSASYEGPTEI